jgi:hypothetical protein
MRRSQIAVVCSHAAEDHVIDDHIVALPCHGDDGVPHPLQRPLGNYAGPDDDERFPLLVHGLEGESVGMMLLVRGRQHRDERIQLDVEKRLDRHGLQRPRDGALSDASDAVQNNDARTFIHRRLLGAVDPAIAKLPEPPLVPVIRTGVPWTPSAPDRPLALAAGLPFASWACPLQTDDITGILGSAAALGPAQTRVACPCPARNLKAPRNRRRSRRRTTTAIANGCGSDFSPPAATRSATTRCSS